MNFLACLKLFKCFVLCPPYPNALFRNLKNLPYINSLVYFHVELLACYLHPLKLNIWFVFIVKYIIVLVLYFVYCKALWGILQKAPYKCILLSVVYSHIRLLSLYLAIKETWNCDHTNYYRKRCQHFFQLLFVL